MKRRTMIGMMVLGMLFAGWTSFAANVSERGAKVGGWTQDYDAALQVAAKEKLPILINFTGSDWCGWCKLMDEKVFAKSEWKKYAEKNLVLVWIDFPQNEKLVPEAFQARNQKLSNEYKIEGFPTFVLLAPDGKTEVARLGASRNITPEKFISEIQKNLKKGDVIKTLAGEKKAAYEKAKTERDAAQAKLDAWIEAQKKKSVLLQKEYETLKAGVEAAEKAMQAVLE